MVTGVLVVCKPRGPTSHDVVARVRRASGERRVGHAGTLDPLAEGVLVLALGQATRLLEYLTGADKRYRATLVLGVETDTYDAEGRPVATAPVSATGADVRAALESFRGTIEQRPPLHSAISVGGRRLYEVARAGGTAEIPMRQVTIYDIQFLRYERPVLEFEVACSSGTYIRSLAHDLGQRLGVGAHLSGLVRLQVGPFRSEDAHPLETVLARLRAGEVDQLLLPPEAAVAHLPRLDLSAGDVRRVRQGQPVANGSRLAATIPAASLRAPAGEEARQMPAAPAPHPLPAAGLVGSGRQPPLLSQAHAPGGELAAIMRYDERAGLWRPVKVLTVDAG